MNFTAATYGIIGFWAVFADYFAQFLQLLNDQTVFPLSERLKYTGERRDRV
jgi:hypothetical protein